MLIRAATDDDLDLLVALRVRFLAEHRGVDETQLSAAFRTDTSAFLQRHQEAGTIRSWLAGDEGGDPVGVVTMLLLDLAPRPEDRSGREGYLINMWVAPPQRGHGIGRALLEACRAEADQLGLRRLLLYATDDGRPLYESVGFHPNPTWMELPL